ncbi:MAG: 16S rRNA (cytosine(1402)-N(4))-methyltransferase RsmH, partial [Gammaproteobacteria bacterium]|nr:16S rRNA (cytosine(1402)-N(4))-methyltransferase RsmH [Gammaproteobacteria bacterium]
RLMVIDKDPEAIAVAQASMGHDARVSIVQGSFAQIKDHVAASSVDRVDGILLDLGVSSNQLDVAERGFSFGKPGPLDMRMDNTAGETAAEWLNRASESEIGVVLKEYGEERHARRIARGIVAARAVTPLQTTQDLAQLVAKVSPSHDPNKHPATRVFQAVRIQVNQELKDIDECLAATPDLLEMGGRLVVISFHSLEDRRAKRFIKQQEKNDPYPSKFPIFDHQIQRPVRSLGKWRATNPELALNPRARSAVMRAMEKIA